MTARKAKVTVSNEATAAGIRVGGYLIGAGFVLEGVDAFNLWESATPAQTKWVMGALTVIFTVLTNWLESRKGRKLLGAPPK